MLQKQLHGLCRRVSLRGKPLFCGGDVFPVLRRIAPGVRHDFYLSHGVFRLCLLRDKVPGAGGEGEAQEGEKAFPLEKGESIPKDKDAAPGSGDGRPGRGAGRSGGSGGVPDGGGCTIGGSGAPGGSGCASGGDNRVPAGTGGPSAGGSGKEAEAAPPSGTPEPEGKEGAGQAAVAEDLSVLSRFCHELFHDADGALLWNHGCGHILPGYGNRLWLPLSSERLLPGRSAYLPAQRVHCGAAHGGGLCRRHALAGVPGVGPGRYFRVPGGDGGSGRRPCGPRRRDGPGGRGCPGGEKAGYATHHR